MMDLGSEWTRITGFPMVFGVFAARKDTDHSYLRSAHQDMMGQLDKFERDMLWRNIVIQGASSDTGISETRLDNYFTKEVCNRLDSDAERGLDLFLNLVCGINGGAEWANVD